MAKRFEIPGKGLGNVPFRADIYDAQYGGSSPSVLDGSGQHLVVDRGQRGDDDTNPIFPSEARIYVRDDADLSPLFKREDREVRIEIIRTDTGNLTFEGFMLTDFFEDAPYLPGDPKVQIRAADGISTLKQRGFDFFYGDGYRYVPYTTGIIELLKDLYPYPKNLDVEFGFEWYPDNPDLDSGDNPLRHMGIKPDNYKEDRGESNSAWWNAFAVLKDMLKDFDLTLRQVQPEGEQAHWHIRHRSALDENSDPAGLKVWRYNHDASLKSGYPKVRTVERDLTEEQFFVDHNRGFDRRWQSFSLKHNHTPVQGLVGEGGFENVPLGPVSDPWTELSFSSDITAEVVEYSDDNVTPDQTQDNQHLFRVKYDPENFSGDFLFPYLIEQDLGSLSGFVGEANGKLTITGGVFSRVNKDSPKGWAEDRLARLIVNGDKEWFLNYRRTNVRQSVNKGTGTVPVDPIDGPIPKGAVVPFVRKDSYHNPNDNSVSESWISYAKSTIKLTERADKGDEILVGEISADVKGKWKVAYPVFDTTKKNGVMIRQHRSRDAGWGTQDIVFPLEDVNGNIVQGDVTLQLGVRINDEDSPNDAPRVNYVAHCYDDVDVEITVRGEPLEETITVTSVSEFGERIGYEVRTSDTPTPGNLARLRGDKSGSYLPQNFGIGPIAQRSNSLALGKLMGREKMRYMREDPERLTLTFPVENGDPYIDAHELLVFDGRYWTISNIKHVVQDGEIEVEVLEYTDHGTSGIIYSVTVQEEGEETSGGGGGGVVGSVSGFGGNPPPTEVLDALHTEDETFLYVASGTGENPDYLSVRAKDEDDMASDSDVHLPTQQSVKAYVDSGSGEAKKNARAIVQTRAEIDALDTVTVRKGREVLISGTSNQVGVSGRDGDLSSNIVLSLSTPQNIHRGADFEVQSLNVDSAASPSAGQVALGAQADETFESVRADRNVSINGTTNQVVVIGRSGTLTQDVNVTLGTPQDIHTGANFLVEKLRVGTAFSPNSGGGHFTGHVGHPDYIAETDHWRIDAAGLGDFRTLLADELRVDAFIAEVNEALAGEDLLTKSFAKLDAPFAVPSSTGGTSPLRVQNLPGLGNSQVFSSGDTVRLRYVDRSGGGLTVADVWLKVTGYTDNGDGTQTWTAELLDSTAASGSDLGEGTLALDYGDPSTGGYLIERSVLDKGGSIAPYDRILKWEDTTGNGVPDDYTVLNLRGELGSLSKAHGSGPGVYTEQGRFTSDVIIGDLDAATSSTGGDFFKFDGSLQIVVTDSEGDERNIIQMADDLKLLARRVTQQEEAQAGIELNVSENAATLTASVQFSETTSNETNRAALELFAGPDGSSATIVGESIQLDGDTIVSGDFTVQEANIGPDFTAQGAESQTIRKDAPPPGENATDGRPIQKGDVWIDTSDGDKPYTYDGTSPFDILGWTPAYTVISGGDITTGTIQGPSGEFSIGLDSGDFILSEGAIKDSVTIGAVDASLIRKGNLTYRQGMEAGASDWSKGASGHTPQFVSSPVWSGSVALRLSSSESTLSRSSGTTDGYYVEIPEEIALEYGGRTIEVTVWAKKDTATDFAVAYSTADVGNSTWRSFSPTSDWEPYRFTYEVPEPDGGGGDYLGLLGDASQGSGWTYFDAITIRPQTEEISGFTITEDRLIGQDFFNGNGSVRAGILNQSPDFFGFQVENFSSNLGQARMYIDDDKGPNLDVIRDGNNQFNITSTAGSNDDEFQLKLIAGGETVLQAGAGGTFIDELGLKDLLIEGTLTMGSGGKIVNNPSSPTDYTIDGDGVTLKAGDPDSGPLARRISWTENGTEVARIAADEGTIESKVNGDENYGRSGMAWYAKQSSSSSSDSDRMKMGMDFRPGGRDRFEFLLPDNGGGTQYPEFEIGKMGTDERGWRYYPNGGMMVWKNPRQTDPSDSYCKNLLDRGEFALYALDEDSSSTTGDVRLKYVERKPDGSISRKSIRD